VQANHKPPNIGDARFLTVAPRGPRRCGLWTCPGTIYP
jgi:hypothetical protein